MYRSDVKKVTLIITTSKFFIERKISIANKMKKFEKAFNITDTVEHDIGMLLLITLSNFSFFRFGKLYAHIHIF